MGRVYRMDFAYQHQGIIHRYDMRALFLGLDTSQVPMWRTAATGATGSQFLAIPKEWVTRIEEARNKPPYLRRVE